MVAVRQDVALELSGYVGQLIDEIEGDEGDQARIDDLLETIKKWGYIGAVIASLAESLLS